MLLYRLVASTDVRLPDEDSDLFVNSCVGGRGGGSWTQRKGLEMMKVTPSDGWDVILERSSEVIILWNPAVFGYTSTVSCHCSSRFKSLESFFGVVYGSSTSENTAFVVLSKLVACPRAFFPMFLVHML